MIALTADTRAAREYLLQIERKEIPRVVGRTLNRTAASTRTASSRFLRNRINLKKNVIDAAIRIRRSDEIQNMASLNLNRAWFEIRWSGKPFPLRDYDARQSPRKGVSYKVSKFSGRKVYKRAGQKAFILQSLGGHVFVRVGADPPGPRKAPIKKVFGPSVPQFAITKREQAQLIKHAQEFFAIELRRNIRFAIARRTS